MGKEDTSLIQRAIYRLRQQRETQTAIYQDGYRSGRDWTLRDASYADLCSIDLGTIGLGTGESAGLYRDRIMAVCQIPGIHERTQGSEIEFQRGFVEGVVDCWRSLRRRVES